jgi:hypothetical protein
MFSASSFWRSWCHSILVRSIEKIGISVIGIAPLRPAAATARSALGRLCRAYG